MKQYYSKEVIKHFKNPKNIGKIKKPSGRGQAGNILCGDIMTLYLKVGENKKKEKIIKDVKFETLGCLPPEEEILINEGDWKEISSIEKGMYVLNGSGEKTQVAETFIRRYRGAILTIIPFVSPFNKFTVTPEHPILSIKRRWLKSARNSSKICEWLRVKEEELLSKRPKYIEAQYLNKSDYLVSVPNKKVKDSPVFTKEMMGLLGYYLSEGYGMSNGVLAFAFDKNSKNKQEKRNISELKSLLFKITNKKPKERIRRTVKEIYICSRKWVNFFVSIAGKLAPKKKLFDEILLLPFEKQWEMIKTYIKGDGSQSKRRPTDFPIYRISTTSKQLAIQTQEILLRGNIFASIKKYTNLKSRNYIEGRKVNVKPFYEISFKIKRNHKFIHFNGKYFLVPIRKIEKRNYQGYVCNLQVKGKPNSYLVKGFAVHNCVVAIANTSLLTTIVKGKKLEDVLKIKKDDLIKRLGQSLPPSKIHCSVLAIDALKEAIYNYYLKNKLEISEELEKEHQRITKTKEELEKKYKGFQASEKEILK